MNDFFEIVRFVGNAAWKVLPFFLLSMFLSVMINMLDLTDAIRKAFAGREGLAVLLATAVGAFSPFCSCTVIPIIAGLLISGVPLAPVMSFWIASPTMDPEIFTLTVGILGWPLALSRLGASLALSLGAGYLTLLLCRLGYFSQILPVGIEQSTQLKTSACCKTQSEAPPLPVTLTVLPAVACCSADRANSKCGTTAGHPSPRLVGVRCRKYPPYRLDGFCSQDGRPELATRPLASGGFHT